MAKQYPNNTSQSGIYYTGGGGYVDVDSTFSTPSGDYETFPARATADSWEDGDLVDVLIRKSEGNLKIWTAAWDATNEYLLLEDEQDSEGTISDSDAVEVTASVTKNAFQFLGARLHHDDTTYTYPTSTIATVWEGADFDFGGWWRPATSTSRLYVPAGVSVINAFFATRAASQMTGSPDWLAAIRHNGVYVSGQSAYSQDKSPMPVMTGPIVVEEDDYFEAMLYCSDSSPANAYSPYHFFSIQAVG